MLCLCINSVPVITSIAYVGILVCIMKMFLCSYVLSPYYWICLPIVLRAERNRTVVDAIPRTVGETRKANESGESGEPMEMNPLTA